MTIIKQVTIKDRSSHQKNLRNYINNDKKVLLRESQNMDNCINLKTWASYMSQTRDMFGHNKSSRQGKDGKPAKNAILLHQILGFNPDECDINDGELSPNDCMRYAKEYAQTYYPNHEIVFALHNEYCKDDQTHRYAVHMVINRSDLKTGKRLDEGKESVAKQKRVSRVRSMDEAWGLKQVEAGKINSTTHHKQPSRVEKELEKKGILPYKTNLRELLRIAAKRTDNITEFRELLDQWGVETSFRNGRMYATDKDNAKYSFSVLKLDAELRPYALDKNRVHEKADHIEKTRQGYLQKIHQLYLDYRKEIHTMGKKPLKDLPKFKIPTPPKTLSNDQEVKKKILAYWRGADELRMTRVSDAPQNRTKQNHATHGQQSNPQHRSFEQNRDKGENRSER